MPVLCKDSASERNESLLLNCRAQPVLCKDNTNYSMNKIKAQIKCKKTPPHQLPGSHPPLPLYGHARPHGARTTRASRPIRPRHPSRHAFSVQKTRKRRRAVFLTFSLQNKIAKQTSGQHKNVLSEHRSRPSATPLPLSRYPKKAFPAHRKARFMTRNAPYHSTKEPLWRCRKARPATQNSAFRTAKTTIKETRP